MDVVLLYIVNQEVVRVQTDHSLPVGVLEVYGKDDSHGFLVDNACNVSEILALHLLAQLHSVDFVVHPLDVLREPSLFTVFIEVSLRGDEVGAESDEPGAEAALCDEIHLHLLDDDDLVKTGAMALAVHSGRPVVMLRLGLDELCAQPHVNLPVCHLLYVLLDRETGEYALVVSAVRVVRLDVRHDDARLGLLSDSTSEVIALERVSVEVVQRELVVRISQE